MWYQLANTERSGMMENEGKGGGVGQKTRSGNAEYSITLIKTIKKR